MRRTLGIVLVGVLLLAGCRAEANIRLDVDAEGAGQLTAEFGFDDELLSFIEDTGASPEDMFDVAATDETLEVTTQGDMTYYSATQQFADLDELNAVVADLAGSESEFADFSLELDGDGGASLSATLVAPDAEEAADLGGMGAVNDVFSASFIADLPGRVETSNADQVLPDGRLRWEIPFEGGRVEIEAVTVAGEGSTFPTGLVVGIALAVLVAAGILIAARRRSDSSASAVATKAPPPPPQGWDDTSPEASPPDDPS